MKTTVNIKNEEIMEIDFVLNLKQKFLHRKIDF